jgi:hypothetical protein
LAGPHVLFHLIFPRAPRVSLSGSFLPPRETTALAPAPQPVRRSAASRAPLRPSSHARRRRSTPRPRRAFTALAPRPHRACAARSAPAPPVRCHAVATPLRRRSPPPAAPAHLPHTPTCVHSRPFQVHSTFDSSTHKVFKELPLRLFLRFLP